MDISQLLIGDAVVEREVEMMDGSKAVMYFREPTPATFANYSRRSNSKDEGIADDADPWLVHQSLCDVDGNLALSFEQARRLHDPLMKRLRNVTLEISGYVKKKAEAGNASPPETQSGSGTS